MFLDPSKPITTCTRSTCEDCSLLHSIHCHFSGKDLAKFFGAAFPVLILGGIGVYRLGFWVFLPWFLFIFSYFGFIEIRVMCSHCPHYAEPGNSLQCWANYGSPRLWRFRPGPMSGMEKVIFFAGLLVIFGFPIFASLSQLSWLLGILYAAAVVGGYMFMRKFMCSQCMNFACPLNLVDEGRKAAFFKINPEYAAGWEEK